VNHFAATARAGYSPPLLMPLYEFGVASGGIADAEGRATQAGSVENDPLQTWVRRDFRSAN
jgi:hypothetical protein